MRYTVVLEQEQDGGYVASVPALPGCVCQGETRAGALDNIREAIELYIEDCREAGDPVPVETGKEFVEVDAAYLPEGYSRAQITIEQRHAATTKRFCRPWRLPNRVMRSS